MKDRYPGQLNLSSDSDWHDPVGRELWQSHAVKNVLSIVHVGPVQL